MHKFLLSAFAAVMTVASARADALPYSQTFDSSDDFKTLTLYHADSDSRDWDYSSSAARFYPGSRYNTYDAWFFLPELEFQAGTQYVVTFDAKISSSGSSNYKNISVNIGSDAAPESQTELFKEEIQSNSYAAKKVGFTVTTDGVYRIGFRTNASSGSLNDILVDNIKVQAYVELPAAATDITATPGEKGALEVTLAWTNPAVNDGGSPLSHLSGVKIKRTDSSLVSMANATEIATVTEGIAAGGTSTFTDTTVPKSGNYYYYIVPFNENGDCPATISSVKSGYVGSDTGLSATKNVVATAVADNEKAIALTWDAPTGTNGGYVDPAGVAWKITRKGPATVVLEEAWTGEVPYSYVDKTITEIGSYSYTVQYVNDGKTETTGATSNKVVTGGVASLPYSQPFSSSSSLDLFTNFAGEASTTGTTWNRPGSYSYVQLAQTTGTMDSWLVTPPFEFKAGAYYDLSFDTSSSSSRTKDFEVMLGQASTAEDLTTSLFDKTLTLSSTAETQTVRFKAEADGRYYIGFHAKGAASSGYLRLTNIMLSEVVVAPVPASALTATADPDGAMKVSLAWTNPTVDVLGNELAAITKIEVLRGTDVIKTYGNAAPGAEMTLVDEVEAPGKYSYSIVCYLGENAGEAATVISDKVGGAMGLPYTADYSSADSFAEWTMPANSSGKKWEYKSANERLEAPDTDGLWLFTPEFKAKKGVVTITLTGARRSSYSETIKVALYKSADPAAEAQSEVKSFTFSSTSNTDAVLEFDVAEAGTYTIGIYRPTSGWNLYLYATTIEQTKAVVETAPVAATDLKITGDADNDHLVHLSWINPSMTEGGSQLAEISKVEISRDGAVVATLTDDLTPGAEATYDDTVDATGLYTYTVVVYNGDDASEPVSAKSPFIGGGFALPYAATLSTADTVEFWTLPENNAGKIWKFETNSQTYRTGLVASSNDVKAYTVPFKASKGELTVTFGAASYNYNYRETVKVGLFDKAEFDAEPVGEWQSQEVSASGYAENVTFTFDVPQKGTYYIGFYIETSRMYFYLSSISIEQPVAETITVLWDNTDARFSRPVVEVDGEDIEMTSYVDPTVVSILANDKIQDINIYKAEIPGGTASIRFKDGNDTAAEPVEIENPHHNWIYSADGTGEEFDEGNVAGIDGIEADGKGHVRYFDLRGVETSSPRQGSLYIVVRDGKATKRIVK